VLVIHRFDLTGVKSFLEDGRFRPDLYYRLSAFNIDLPPLRERGDDLPMLVRHNLRLFGRDLGREFIELSPNVMDHLRDYPWPGNIRELQNVLRQAAMILGIARQTLRSKLRELGVTIQSSVDFANNDES
jgi:DNA-binding NtrC family response regulator